MSKGTFRVSGPALAAVSIKSSRLAPQAARSVPPIVLARFAKAVNNFNAFNLVMEARRVSKGAPQQPRCAAMRRYLTLHFPFCWPPTSDL
jgi:hypothetical protein